MNSLTKSLIKDFLPESIGGKEVTALFGGGFKPPTAGHLEVIQKAIKNHPEIDNIIIYVGSKVRDGITQDQSFEVWDRHYKQLIDKPVRVEKSVSPIGDIYRYAKDNPEDSLYWIIGSREGREDDLQDISSRSISLNKYPNLNLKTIVTPDGGMSGTNARNALINNDKEAFNIFLPNDVNQDEVWNILSSQPLNEIELLTKLKDWKRHLNKAKKGFNKFIEALKQEKQETKDAFKLLYQAVKEKKELTKEEKKEIGNQLKDIFKTIGYVGLFALPGGSIFTILFNLLKLNKYVLPSAFLDKEGLNEADPKKGTGKKPKGSGRRLYTDEDPSDTVKVKFSTRQDIVDTLNKKSFKSKSHARQSQIINLIHQRVRAALGRTKDPQKKDKLRSAFEYIKKRKEASKKKTQRLKKENIDPKAQSKHKGKAAPFGSAYEPVNEGDTYEKMAAKGKKAGSLKQGTVRSRLKIPKDKKIPLSLINKELARLRKMDKDKKKKGVQLGDKNQKYYKALQLAKTLKTTTNVNETGLEIAKKNMDDYKKSNQLNENATYSNHIDYKQEILDLTKHMLKKGMNIKPLPRVIFKHNDKENAQNFLGKTAYYDPNNMLIVLYTEGRHPKDIARSYAHEMIHHIQNLEDRLENITTTNTMEDDHLNNIEREAYTRGNMVFRNYTDGKDGEEVTSLNEKEKPYKHKYGFDKSLGKDPFGLNQFARELATLEEGRYDTLSNQISRDIFQVWKEDFKEGDEVSTYEDTYDFPPRGIDVKAQIQFTPGLKQLKVDGGSDEARVNPKTKEKLPGYLEVTFEIDPKMLPEFWEEISMNLKDVVRHEIEHITQSGDSKTKKEKFEDDSLIRALVKAKLIPQAEYFYLPKEVDANLQGMYFRAKKEKRPFGDVINTYLDAQDITPEEKEKIINLWRSRRKALSLPQF